MYDIVVSDALKTMSILHNLFKCEQYKNTDSAYSHIRDKYNVLIMLCDIDTQGLLI